MIFICNDYVSFVFTDDIEHKIIRMVKEDKTKDTKERGIKLWTALDKIIKAYPTFKDLLAAEGITLETKQRKKVVE